MCMCLPWSVLGLLILIISVVGQEGDNDCPENMFQQCHEDLEEKFVCVYSRNKDGIMKLNGSISLEMDEPEFPDSRLPLNIRCNVSHTTQETHLYIHWDTSDFPDNAEYSICYRLSNKTEILDHKVLHVEGPVYHTLIPKHTDRIILQFNVSFQDIWFIQKQEWRICDIEKPDPPKITNATIQSSNLYLEWNLPKCADTNPICFEYQLRINDEPRLLEEKLHIELPMVPAQAYKIQMRARNKKCCDSLIWSDWTSVSVSPSEVGSPATHLTDLHIGVIIAIALGLPMILLAILLLCKFQRVFDKLFPPIPGPSIKIKGLLEKDITSQIMSYKCVEEVTEVEVKEDELEEKENEKEHC